MMEDGELLVETAATLRYLASKFPAQAGRLYATDPTRQYVIDKWLDFWADAFRPAFAGFIDVCLASKFIGQREPTEIELSIAGDRLKSIDAVLRKLSDELEKPGNTFIAGSQLSLADYVLFAQMMDYRYLQYNMSGYPRLLQYEADMMAASPGIANLHGPTSNFTRVNVPFMNSITNIM